jgi:8-oxo-dGTP diphosphatase
MTQFYASADEMNMPFHGAKLALYLGARLAVILRDDDPAIAFPGAWDFPGGGREGDETPIDCVLRETREELGLIVPAGAIRWGRSYVVEQSRRWFFVAYMPARTADHVVFGDEGQHWALMDQAAFVGHSAAVPVLQDRLRGYLEDMG